MAAKAAGIVAAGLAVAANAFMIIPGTEPKDWPAQERIEASRTEASAGARWWVFHLPCQECVAPKSLAAKDGVSIRLNVSLSDDQMALNLNGKPWYPTGDALFAHQVPLPLGISPMAEDAVDALGPPSRLLYHSAAVASPVADGVDAEIIRLDLDIHGIDGTRVSVDALTLDILSEDDGRLQIIGAVERERDSSSARKITPANILDDILCEYCVPPFENFEEAFEIIVEPEEEHEFSILPIEPFMPAHPFAGSRLGPHDDEDMKKAHEQPECHGPEMLCRLKAIIDGKIGMMRETIEKHMGDQRPHGKKPCPGMMKRPHGGMSGVPPVPVKGGPAKFWNMDHPHPHHRGGRHGHAGHRHHRHNHGIMHRIVHGAQRLFFGFALPVMIGIAAGLTASVLGMLVGTCIAWLWIKLVRGGRRGAASRASASAQEAGEATEKASLMADAVGDDDEPLPAYVEKS